jgi:hypothetical protein
LRLKSSSAGLAVQLRRPNRRLAWGGYSGAADKVASLRANAR